MDVRKLIITVIKDQSIPSNLTGISNRARTFSEEPPGLANRDQVDRNSHSGSNGSYAAGGAVRG